VLDRIGIIAWQFCGLPNPPTIYSVPRLLNKSSITFSRSPATYYGFASHSIRPLSGPPPPNPGQTHSHPPLTLMRPLSSLSPPKRINHSSPLDAPLTSPTRYPQFTDGALSSSRFQHRVLYPQKDTLFNLRPDYRAITNRTQSPYFSNSSIPYTWKPETLAIPVDTLLLASPELDRKNVSFY